MDGNERDKQEKELGGAPTIEATRAARICLQGVICLNFCVVSATPIEALKHFERERRASDLSSL